MRRSSIFIEDNLLKPYWQDFLEGLGIISFVKVLGDPPQQVKIRTVNPFLNNKEKQEAVERISYQHQRQYYLLVEEIKTRQEARAQWVEKEEENILPKPTAFRDKRRSKI